MGEARKFTVLPAQLGLPKAVMLTETGDKGVTIMVIAFDVAGLLEVQGSEEVNIHVTMSPFAGA